MFVGRDCREMVHGDKVPRRRWMIYGGVSWNIWKIHGRIRYKMYGRGFADVLLILILLRICVRMFPFRRFSKIFALERDMLLVRWSFC